MPRIFDNIATDLLPALRDTLEISQRSDFCVGYFNLRDWKAIDGLIEEWAGGEGAQGRLLVGMQRLAQDAIGVTFTQAAALNYLNALPNATKELAPRNIHTASEQTMTAFRRLLLAQ
jgi:hypothetical protein